MSSVEQVLFSNAVFVVPMCLLVWLITRVVRSPHVAHGLWLLVLVKLMTPPLVDIPLPSWQLASLTEATPAAPAISEESPNSRQAATISVSPPLSSNGVVDLPAAASAAAWPIDSVLGIRVVLLLIWGAGAAVVATRAGWQIWQFNRLVDLAGEADDAVVTSAAALGRAMGLRRLPRMVTVARPMSPALWAGTFRPAIVLPKQVLAGMQLDDQRAVIAHELAHYARGDHWVRWLELAVNIAYWWHPAAWLARRELRYAEELCCDARAIAHCRHGSSADYASTLLTMMDLLEEPQMRLASGMGSKSQLKKRIRILAQHNIPTASSWRTRFALCMAAALFLPFQFARGQNETKPAPQTTDTVQAAPVAAQSEQLRPGDVIVIVVTNVLPGWPIAGEFIIESGGGVALGPHYGRVQIMGETVETAESKIKEHLQQILTGPEVQVTRPFEGRIRVDLPAPVYRISPDDILQIRVANALPQEPIDGLYRVESTGNVAVGPTYGRVAIAGLTLEEAEEKIKESLGKILQGVMVSVSHGEWLCDPANQQMDQRAGEADKTEWSRQQREYVKLLQREFERAQARAKEGDNHIYDRALAGYEWSMAAGQLAASQGETEKMREWYRQAKKFVDEGLDMARAEHDAGSRELRDVLLMARKQQEVNMILLGTAPPASSGS